MKNFLHAPQCLENRSIKSHFLKEEWSKEFSNFGRPLGQQKPKSPPGIVEGLPTCLFFLDNDTQVLHEATEGLFRVVEVVDLLKSEIFFSLFNASFAYLCNTFATALLT